MSDSGAEHGTVAAPDASVPDPDPRGSWRQLRFLASQVLVFVIALSNGFPWSTGTWQFAWFLIAAVWQVAVLVMLVQWVRVRLHGRSRRRR
ncbi:hypothetical protein OEB99_00100 [Actinotalea sp. M2MS4P-6]|uniref:hypothetical protein n=1 Tax=Actinotalea sp. M2MS4P-6 TaxID=2983762 RepID=UPI0021E3E77A|nr:hypothetical protein [Actinotalea sp. M2MS4P-6]MCV2392698.1 hypothetical protein [Actinotalea sp. M2MS4P-6]